MICSMTIAGAARPELINGSRRRRIAAGSGTTIQDVNRLLTQFEQMKKMMRGLTAGRPRAMPGCPAWPGGGRQTRRQQQKEQAQAAARFQISVRAAAKRILMNELVHVDTLRKENNIYGSKDPAAPHGREEAARSIVWWWPTAARPATGASSRPLATTTRASSRPKLKIDGERAGYWLGCGAQPSDTAAGAAEKAGHCTTPIATEGAPTAAVAE